MCGCNYLCFCPTFFYCCPPFRCALTFRMNILCERRFVICSLLPRCINVVLLLMSFIFCDPKKMWKWSKHKHKHKHKPRANPVNKCSTSTSIIWIRLILYWLLCISRIRFACFWFFVWSLSLSLIYNETSTFYFTLTKWIINCARSGIPIMSTASLFTLIFFFLFYTQHFRPPLER